MSVYTETIFLKDEVSPSAHKASSSVADLSKGIQAANKQLVNTETAASGTGKSVAGLSGDFGGLQAELAEATGGLSIVVEAMGAVALGFGALVLAGAAFAVKASEAKQASLSLWSALGQGKITGEQVDDMLDEMRASTGLTKDSLGLMAQQFLKMGVTGKDALEGLTIAAASAEGLAKGGAEAFGKLYGQAKVAGETGSKLSIPYKKLNTQLMAMGLTVDDLAKSMGMSGADLTKGLKAGTVDAKKFGDAMQESVTKKGAGPLQTLANSSANLGGLLKEYLGDLFEDLGDSIKPFMAEVKSLFGILDSKANPSGMALKEGIGAFFKQVFSLATKVVPMIKHFLLDVIIYGLKAYIALKPIVKWFLELKNNTTFMSTLVTMWEGLKSALIVVGVVIGAVIGFFFLMVAASAAVALGIVSLVGIIGSFIGDSVTALAGWAISAAEAAYNFVAGLVQGITNGAGLVVDAVKGLASAAVKGFEGSLRINSPSVVMDELGGHAATGFAQGIEGGAGDVHGAATGLAGAAAAGASASPVPSGGGGGKSVSVTVEPGAIVINGASGSSAIELTEEAISLVFERIALGAGV